MTISDMQWMMVTAQHYFFWNILGIILSVVKYLFKELFIKHLWALAYYPLMGLQFSAWWSCLAMQAWECPRKIALQEQQEIPTYGDKQWKICWVQNEIISSCFILYMTFVLCVSQAWDWIKCMLVRETKKGKTETKRTSGITFRPLAMFSDVTNLYRAMSSVKLCWLYQRRIWSTLYRCLSPFNSLSIEISAKKSNLSMWQEKFHQFYKAQI